MSKRRKRIDKSGPQQLSLFDEILRMQQDLAATRPNPTEGSLNVADRLRRSMINAIKPSHYSCVHLRSGKRFLGRNTQT